VLQEQSLSGLADTDVARGRACGGGDKCDLPRMVANREFRSDLYYRLNVFPVRLPALRERSEDIAPLVRHFVDLYSRRMNKQFERVPQAAMQDFPHLPMAGNVRELQNFIERSVILSTGKVLQPPSAELKEFADGLDASVQSLAPKAVTLKDVERDHIHRRWPRPTGSSEVREGQPPDSVCSAQR